MAYERLAELINNNEWELAENEFQAHRNDIWTDELAILAATLFFQNNAYEDAYESIQKGLRYNITNYELYFY